MRVARRIPRGTPKKKAKKRLGPLGTTPRVRNSRAKRKAATAERMKKLSLNQPSKKPELTLNQKRAIRLMRTPKTQKDGSGGFAVLPERIGKQSAEERAREAKRKADNRELGLRGGKHGTGHNRTSSSHGRNR